MAVFDVGPVPHEAFEGIHQTWAAAVAFATALYGSAPSIAQVHHGYSLGEAEARIYNKIKKVYKASRDPRKSDKAVLRRMEQVIQDGARSAAQSAPSGFQDAAGSAVAQAARRHVSVTGRVSMSSIRRGKRMRGGRRGRGRGRRRGYSKKRYGRYKTYRRRY